MGVVRRVLACFEDEDAVVREAVGEAGGDETGGRAGADEDEVVGFFFVGWHVVGVFVGDLLCTVCSMGDLGLNGWNGMMESREGS